MRAQLLGLAKFIYYPQEEASQDPSKEADEGQAQPEDSNDSRPSWLNHGE